jgi:hypothetical protein
MVGFKIQPWPFSLARYNLNFLNLHKSTIYSQHDLFLNLRFGTLRFDFMFYDNGKRDGKERRRSWVKTRQGRIRLREVIIDYTKSRYVST